MLTVGTRRGQPYRVMSDMYWIAVGSEQKGPYTFAQIQSMWRSGGITADTLYCQEGFEEWVPLSGLSELLDAQPPRAVAQQAVAAPMESDKRILPALILCLFLGLFGAHAFYAGRWKQGIAVIACLLSPFFLLMVLPLRFGLIAFYLPILLVVVHVLCDLVRILVGSYKDGAARKITKWT
jgi:TM2 domain-containing membrane protein YozV